MIHVVALARAKPGSAERVRAGLEALIAPTRAESTNHLYVLHASADDPNLFVFYETWDSREALDAHMQTPHLKAFGAQTGDALAAPLEVHVLHEIGAGAPPA